MYACILFGLTRVPSDHRLRRSNTDDYSTAPLSEDSTPIVFLKKQAGVNKKIKLLLKLGYNNGYCED